MKFVSTSTFRKSKELLIKRADSGYISCVKDISNELKGQSFEDIFNRHYLLRQMGNLRVIKLRVQNSFLSYSSAAGYRLIIICNSKLEHIALLDVYPKKGKHSKSDLTKSEFRELINNYGKELSKGTLLEFQLEE